MKAILYCRINQQSKDYDLKKQETELRQYCNVNGYQVDRVVSECCTGSVIGDKLQLAMKLMQASDVDAIIVRDISRVSRNMYAVSRVINHLMEQNKHLIGAVDGDWASHDDVSAPEPWRCFLNDHLRVAGSMRESREDRSA